MIIKNDAGEEQEVFTPEELQQKVTEAENAARQAAVEEYKAANPDKSAELEEAKNAAIAAEAKLQEAVAAGGNEGQVNRLRSERDAAIAAEKAAKEEAEKKVAEIKNQTITDTRTEWLDRLSSGNKAMRDKIEFEFEKYNPNDNSKEGIKQRMETAFKIVSDGKPAPSFTSGASDASGRGAGGTQTMSVNSFNDNERAIAKKLGIADADIDNYLKAKQVK